MSSYLDDPDTEIRSLPQCGFGADIDFDSLIKSNRFLFRVYTPKERSPFSDDTDPFFIAPRFDERVARSPVDLPKVKFSEPLIGSYAEVARHMEWTTRTSSSYISTSFSFSWSIWEAIRRYHQGIKKDVEIAIIDASALGGRAATAVQLLQKSSPVEQTDQYWKWHRFSQESQSVLVYAMVSQTAVLASVPLLQILRKMPSYFLRKDIQTIYGNPLDQVAWNFTLRKHNYRQFCQDMSKLFLGHSPEVRLRDSTAGSVRLALSFLRPFFHRVVQVDFDIAISYLRTLANTISEWPGGDWVKDHHEIRKIIDVMVLSLGEELREKYFIQKQAEISRLQLVIEGLQQTVVTHKAVPSKTFDIAQIESDDDSDIELEESEDPTLVAMDLPPVLRKRPSLQMSVTVLPHIPVVFQTPITPPESPRNSLFVPTINVPLGDTVSTPSSLKHSIGFVQTIEEPELSNVKTSPASEEPASPPPTPPSRSPVFLLRKLSPVVEDPDASNGELSGVEPKVHFSFPPPVPQEPTLSVSEQDQDQGKQEHASLEGPSEDIQEQKPGLVGEEMPEDAQEEGIVNPEAHTAEDVPMPASDDEDDGEETDLEPSIEHEHYVPPSPSTSWVSVPRMRPKLSSFSSTRSSIASMDTLCDPIEFPLKRMSLATSDSFEFVPPYTSFRSFGITSRTISFSEPSPRCPLSPVLDPLSIPLPPSPQISIEYLSSSRSTSGSSSSSLFPASPSISLDSRSSSPSPSPLSPPSVASSSSLGSLPGMPTRPLEIRLPILPGGVIIPPKEGIRLLSPLPEVLEVDDDDNSSIRSIRVTETASYLVTGFLVGAFITLFLFSTQRRQLMMLT